MNDVEIPREARDVPQAGKVDQWISAGGGVVAEISRATAPIGRTHGYLARQMSKYAAAGCTCGWWSDGPAETVQAEFTAHVEGHQ